MAQTQFTCCHTNIKLVLFRSGCSFFLFFFFILLSLLEDEDQQNVRSRRRGEMRNGCHSDSLIIGDLTRIMPFRAESK